MTLATSTVVSSSPPRGWVLFLHGILGSRANWRTLARRLVDRRPEWGAVLIDLRMHGDSQGVPGPHTVAAAAADLDPACAQLTEPVVGVLGHSFGGKVALSWLTSTPTPPRIAWLIDSRLGSQPVAAQREDTARHVVAMLESLPGSWPDKRAFVDAVKERGYPEPLARWLAMNLERREDGTQGLRLDLTAVSSLLDDYFSIDLWPLVESPREGVDIHMVLGGSSPVLDENDRARARRVADHPRVHVHEIAGAGHWVHVDAPDALLDVLAD